MRVLKVIGIGPGDPRQITVEAVEALQDVEVFFALDKEARSGSSQVNQSLVGARREICRRYIGHDNWRFVEIDDPPRSAHPPDYAAEVVRWHQARADRLEQALLAEIAESGIAAVLVWGDPALYDSTLRVTSEIRRRGVVELAVEVIPGVTSASALTAAHQILANRIGEPIHITTGRRLADTPAGAAGNQIVMLDADCAFRHTAAPTDHIWWGAYLGTPDQILIEGTVADVGERIVQTRAAARQRHGWIMDIYLLRTRELP
ncbi:precorrin-6A synthase (deacetylating) [Mycolicibacterium neoaurum]|uniref:precorrin-6A synthase (deacetylating) n=1 Tax=Mycolicibacterium neoaurum TaxID=1795 RepID=UPI002673D67A|nr:precorrin-6A synthase (deacetylating) [Mycolicibacterium neoaurum]MDO3401610.1 precorrin-6A synthase (deacetylating) [Mycolicibacterium neoaurum]